MTAVKALLSASFAAAIFGASLMPSAASAAPCSVTDVTTSTACIGPLDGNDSPNNDSGSNTNINLIDPDGDLILGAFNIGDWALEDRVNEPATTSGILTLTYASGKSGTWSATGLDAFNNVMIAIKGSTGFALYLIDIAGSAQGGGLFGGSWSVAGLENAGGSSNPPDISHLSLYTSGVATPIPLPAAAWMLIAGLGGLGLLARRKTA
jgi:hypothetical protein